MHMLRYGKGTLLTTVMAGLLALSLLTAGCGSTTPTKSTAVSVKAMKVLQQDTAVSHDYSGQIKSTNAVTIKPRVSGEIVEKYFTAGDPVEKGQPLYKIDDRQYESEVLSAKSNVDKARTTLNNSLVDLNRYQQLAASGAVAEQTLTNQQATVDSNQSSYDDANALLQKAQENLDDTIIRAPISGKLSVDDVPSGTYVTAGNTALVSVGSINPIYVQFSISENEFLNFRMANDNEPEDPTPPTASLTLSNGKKYDETSTSYQFDREVSDSTGTITVKALFNNADGVLLNNADGVLLPGMFARVTMEGHPLKDAILVPQRAVQQVLDQSFVIVVGSDNKSVARVVTLGDQVGSYYIVKSGLDKDDVVVVEGLSNLKEGQDLDVTMTTADELGLSLTASDSSASTSSVSLTAK